MRTDGKHPVIEENFGDYKSQEKVIFLLFYRDLTSCHRGIPKTRGHVEIAEEAKLASSATRDFMAW
jgi:hypothetical protein